MLLKPQSLSDLIALVSFLVSLTALFVGWLHHRSEKLDDYIKTDDSRHEAHTKATSLQDLVIARMQERQEAISEKLNRVEHRVDNIANGVRKDATRA